MIKTVIKILLAVYIILVLIFVVRILNGESCGSKTYTYYRRGEIEPAFTLQSAGSEILTHNPYHDEFKSKSLQLCFTANTTAPVKLEIVDLGGQVYADLVIDDYARHCYEYRQPTNKTINFIGFNCPTCSASGPKVTFYQEVLGVDVERVTVQNNAFNNGFHKALDWEINVYPTCWNSIKYFTNWLVTGGVMLLILWLLLLGVNKAEEVLFRD